MFLIFPIFHLLVFQVKKLNISNTNDCLKKFNGYSHPERKERLESILSSIKSSNLKVEFKEAPLADLETVSLVHPKQHIEQIFSNIPKEGVVGVEKEPYADTMLCPESKNAILKITKPSWLDLNEKNNSISEIKFNPTIKSELGIGLVWIKIPPNGEPMYKDKITLKQLMHRVNTYHRPYHKILKNMLDNTYKKFGKFDFKKIHPAGNLGAQLKTVEDIMLIGNKIPFADESLKMKKALKI